MDVYQQEVDMIVSLREQLQLGFFPPCIFGLLVQMFDQSLGLGQCGSLFGSEQILNLAVPPLDGAQQLGADFLTVFLHGLGRALRRKRFSNTSVLLFCDIYMFKPQRIQHLLYQTTQFCLVLVSTLC